MAKPHSVKVRLEVTNQAAFKRALKTAGIEGEAALKRIGVASQPASKGLLALNAASREGQRAMQAYAAQAGPLGAVLSSMGKGGLAAAAAVGALSGALAVRKLVDYADTWNQARNRVGLFTESQEEANAVLDILVERSNEARVSLSSTADLFQRLSQANAVLRLSQSRLLGVMDTVNKAIVVSGGSAQSADASITQLGQALASGELRGDELRSVLEQTPRLAQAIADGLGVTIGEMRQLGTAGELTAAKVIGALEHQASAVQSEFDRLAPTVGQAMTVATNSVLQFVGALDKAFGASERLAGAIIAAGDAAAKGAKQISGGDSGRPVDAISQSRQETYDFLGQFFRDLSLQADKFSLGNHLAFNVPKVPQFQIDGGQNAGSRLRPGRSPDGFNVRGGGGLASGFDQASVLNRSIKADIFSSIVGELGKLEAQFRVLSPAIDESKIVLDEFAPAMKRVKQEGDPMADLQRQIAREQADLNRVYQESAAVVGRLFPKMQGFAAAGAAWLNKDPIGVVFNSIHGLMDVMGVARDPIDRLADSIREIKEASEDAADARRSVLSRLDSSAYDAVALDRTEPIAKALERLMKPVTEMVEDENGRPVVTTTQRSQYEAVRALINQAREIEAGGGVGTDLQDEISKRGFNAGGYRAVLDEVFGSDSISRAVEDTLELRNVFEDLSSSAKAAAGSTQFLEDAIKQDSDIRRMTIRQQFAGDARLSGSDKIEKASAIKELRALIEAEQTRAKSAVRSLQVQFLGTSPDPGGDSEDGSVPPPSQRPGGGDQDLPDSYDLTWDDIFNVPDDPMVLEWKEAIEFSDKINRDAWADIVRVPGWNRRIEVRWERAIKMTDKYFVNDSRDGWDDVIAITDSMKKVDAKWEKAINMTGALSFTWKDVFGGPANLPDINLPSPVPVHMRSILRPYGKLVLSDLVDPRGYIPLDIRSTVRVRNKLNLTDIVDLGSIHAIVDRRVAENERNRKTSSTSRYQYDAPANLPRSG